MLSCDEDNNRIKNIDGKCELISVIHVGHQDIVRTRKAVVFSEQQHRRGETYAFRRRPLIDQKTKEMHPQNAYVSQM